MYKFEVGKCYCNKHYGESSDYITVYKVISRTDCSVKVVCLKERYTWCACDGCNMDWKEINDQPKTHRVRVDRDNEESISLGEYSGRLYAHHDIFEEWHYNKENNHE